MKRPVHKWRQTARKWREPDDVCPTRKWKEADRQMAWRSRYTRRSRWFRAMAIADADIAPW